VAEKISAPAVEAKKEEQASLKPEEPNVPKISVQEAWAELTKLKEAQGKINEHILLNNRKLEIEGDVVRFTVDNAFQADYLAVFKAELVDYLRSKTGMNSLYVEYRIEKKEDNTIKAYTPTEKFQYLVQKHPSLNELRQKLGLELDF
jgi:DNA polymerase III subunit gamma/tau